MLFGSPDGRFLVEPSNSQLGSGSEYDFNLSEAGLEQNSWAGLDDLMEDGSDYEDI